MMNSAINFIYDSVIKRPDKQCLADEKERLTFREFFSKAYTISEVLKKEKTVNQPIFVYLPKSASAVTCFAAILMSGNFYVPADVKSPAKRVKAILKNLEPHKIISMRAFKDDLIKMSIDETKILYVDDLDMGDVDDVKKAVIRCREFTDCIIDSDPCYIMYTSGSTGTPKGVVVPHRGVIDYIDWAVKCLAVDENENIGNQAPLYFDNSTLDVYLSWATGAHLYLIPEHLFAFPVRLIDDLEEKKINFIFVVPTVLINISKMKLLTDGRLPLLKKIVFAGEVMPAKHLAYWQDNLPGRMYANLYGPTEITVDCTYFIVDRKYKADESLPIGYPCHNSGVLILNENDKAAVDGEQGELCVRGASLALGYWNDPEKTGKVFVQNPLQKNYNDLIYRTGDLVYRDAEGRIIYVGRKDSQIKHMGNRIELGEIETAVMTIRMVQNCCTLYNNNNNEIALFYEANEEIPIGDLIKTLSQSLPRYMLPRKIHYLTKMPINQNGKIDRVMLKNTFY